MKLFLAFGTTNSEVLDNDNNANMSFYTYSICNSTLFSTAIS
ncbi:hypothetical protein ABMY45_20330 [Pseudoalteromonas sp. XMcav11-Q]